LFDEYLDVNGYTYRQEADLGIPRRPGSKTLERPNTASAGDENSPRVEKRGQEAAGDHKEWPEVKTVEDRFSRAST